jgi:hypothetical protein
VTGSSISQAGKLADIFERFLFDDVGEGIVNHRAARDLPLVLGPAVGLGVGARNRCVLAVDDGRLAGGLVQVAVDVGEEVTGEEEWGVDGWLGCCLSHEALADCDASWPELR